MSLPINYAANREWAERSRQRARENQTPRKCLERGQVALQRSPLKAVSLKGQKRNKAYKNARADYLEANPCCAVCAAAGKRTEATEIHHKDGREGSNLTDATTFLAVCNLCHRQIHAFPAWARENGFLGSKFTTTEEETE